MTVGLIGYGRFGKLAARYMSKRARVVVFDRQLKRARFPSRRIRRGSLAEVAHQEIVVLAVPISSLRKSLLSIRSSLRPSTIVIDVCSVKVQPARWMKELLPSDVHILGTHPVFGPDSADSSLKGHRVALCPVRIPGNLLNKVTAVLKDEGLVPKVMTADQHDRMMAQSLFLTQFVGRVVSRSALRRHDFSTSSYADLMKIVETADNDTRELFRDMFRYNTYAIRVLEKLVSAVPRVLNDLR